MSELLSTATGKTKEQVVEDVRRVATVHNNKKEYLHPDYSVCRFDQAQYGDSSCLTISR